jgi:hypothetical protein
VKSSRYEVARLAHTNRFEQVVAERYGSLAEMAEPIAIKTFDCSSPDFSDAEVEFLTYEK